MQRSLLDTITSPEDLRRLEVDQLPLLATEIRAELLDIVAATGGHLASNLGVVELTIALLRVFDLSRDRMVWDTGHQGYVYKLLTGRRKLMRTLRQDEGCCGFLHPDESPFDVFGAGHAGTAISAALGMAAARDISGEDGRIVAIVGDGALGSGISLEGLNSIIETTRDFILVLNDNRMSIAPNVGALSRYLNRVIAGEPYNRIKHVLANLVTKVPRIGPRLRRSVQRLEEATKSVLVPGVLFEELGLRYIGPLDGHDLEQLIRTFDSLVRISPRRPLVVHVLTEKGHGYPYAEQAPEDYHGLSRFDVSSGQPVASVKGSAPAPTFSQRFGEALARRLEADPAVVAITAGMCQGTGLKPVRERYPDRFFDVGIAEEHAVVFAAGMARSGFRPLVAIYASFMQRAMDYVFHDVCLQRLPVIFCLDRAGAVEDGPTHHGIQDLGFWRSLPNLAILQPADGTELEQMLALLLDRKVPAVIRYPKGSAAEFRAGDVPPVQWGRADVLRDGADVAIWAAGREAARAMEVAADLAECGIQASVVNPRFLVPFDSRLLLEQLAAGMPVVTLEDHVVEGGLASIVKEIAVGSSGARLHCKGWPRSVIPWGTTDGIRARFGLDRPSLGADIQAFVRDGVAEARQ